MKIITGIFIAASVLSLSACGTTGTVDSATSSAMIGAAAGAIAGKSTGNHKDSRAVKGAAIGAAAGYVYGKQVEAQRKRQYQNNGYGY